MAQEEGLGEDVGLEFWMGRGISKRKIPSAWDFVNSSIFATSWMDQWSL